MATQRINIPVELFAQLQVTAEAAGKSVDELASEALLEIVQEKRWQTLLARGKEYGRKSGIHEDEVVDAIHEWRDENRRR